MTEIDFDTEMLDQQIDFEEERGARYILLSGRVGSGKTYGIVLRSIMLMLEYEGIVGIIAAQTFPILQNTTLKEFMSVCPEQIISKYERRTQALHIVHFINGSQCIFMPADDPTKIKSYNVGFIAIEEMTDVDEEWFKMARTRLRQPGVPAEARCLFGATNPGSFGNWVYGTFIEEPIENSKVIYSSSFDNIYLPEDYIYDLKTLKETNPEYYQRMVEGKWGALEGLIYNMPLESRVALPEAVDRVIAGLDFGYTHPSGLSIIGVIGEEYFIIDELYEYKLSSSELIDVVSHKIQEYQVDTVYCDGARPEIMADLEEAGVPVQAGIKDVFAGIMYVKGLIGQNRLKVCTDCKYHLREFDSYIWDKQNKVKEVPLKVNDHLMDALRYALYTENKKRVEYSSYAM